MIDELAKLKMNSMTWDKLHYKFDGLAKLDCNFDKLAKLRMSSMGWISWTVCSMSWIS